MIATVLKRCGIGFLLGVAIGNIISLFAAGPSGPVVNPEFAALMGGGPTAVLWQMLMFGLYGAAAMSGTIFYELPDWSLLRCSAVHGLIICGLYVPMALILGLVRSLAELLVMECILLAACAVIWLAVYLWCKAQVRELNRLLEENREQTERRKTMDKKKLIPIISMVSVLVMFIWSWLEGNWSHSWLAVFAGGIAIAAISILSKNDKDG